MKINKLNMGTSNIIGWLLCWDHIYFRFIAILLANQILGSIIMTWEEACPGVWHLIIRISNFKMGNLLIYDIIVLLSLPWKSLLRQNNVIFFIIFWKCIAQWHFILFGDFPTPGHASNLCKWAGLACKTGKYTLVWISL